MGEFVRPDRDTADGRQGQGIDEIHQLVVLPVDIIEAGFKVFGPLKGLMAGALMGSPSRGQALAQGPSSLGARRGLDGRRQPGASRCPRTVAQTSAASSKTRTAPMLPAEPLSEWPAVPGSLRRPSARGRARAVGHVGLGAQENPRMRR